MTASAAAAASSSNSVMQAYLTQQAQEVAADQAAAASGASANSSSALASATSASSIGSNFNTFIHILTTQLQNQDPTNATDPNQFTEELVQFAGVEQQLNTNNDLQTMITLQKNTSGTGAALSYMGQYVEATTTTGQMVLENGNTEIGYTLPTEASSSTITVQNSAGTTVATLSGPTTAGLNYLSWNGQDANGNQLPDGAYTYNIVANDAGTGVAESVTDMRVLGLVTGVTTAANGSNNLTLGNSTSVGTANVDSVFGTNPNNLPSATTGAAATNS